MKLIDALRTDDVLTLNGMSTHSTTLNACTDLFANIGAMRGQDKNKVILLFLKAYKENPLNSMKILFWARDIREGCGERQIFKDIVEFLIKNYPDAIKNNMHLISEFGRWDDLLITENTKLEDYAIKIIVNTLRDSMKSEDNNKIMAGKNCAKWMPRKGTFANKIRRHMNISPKEYRQMLVKLSNTVEQKMCAKDLKSINYSHVPSLAMSRYTSAFLKNDPIRFDKFKDDLKNNKNGVKVNVGAIYPYDIIKSIKNNGDKDVCQKQWESLPNFLLDNNNERILPMCDVSSSMNVSIGNNKKLSALDVSLSLALYISERNVGFFKDTFMEFTNVPKLNVLVGNISDRLNQVKRCIGYNTNLEAAFNSLLDQAVKHKVPQSEMPTALLIISDMEFDAFKQWENPNAQTMCELLYTKANEILKNEGTDIIYTVPKTIWWKVNSRPTNNPVQFAKNGSVLISGFSPAIMKSLFNNNIEIFSTYNIMMNTISNKRYECIV